MRDLKSALVTGAGRRIGRAIALDLAAAGYAVVVHYNGSGTAAEETVARIEAEGGRAVALKADLTNEAEVTGLVARAVDAVGPLNLLVNNASVFEPDLWDTVSRDSWDKHMEANLRAPFVLMQSFARLLPEGERGAIVNIIDQRVWNLTPNYMSYTLAKAGLWTLTQTMALALAPGIRVNAIGPGPTLSNRQQDPADFEEQWKSIPMRRKTELSDICDGVRFLADAGTMTGQMIALDGGEHLGWAQPVNGFVPTE